MSLVSIIIPTYNVEQYLRSCLESIEAQTHEDLQILIVDDESSDASPYIAKQFAEKDARFQHVRQANRGPGPGGGRNGGLPYVEGDWIFFLDSDDLIPPDAIEKLVTVGDRAGSDIVTGNVARFRKLENPWQTPNHAQSHHMAVDNTHILRYPVLAYDTTAWNKIYRTEFWNGAERLFPEQKLFEDINPITRAHCESARTDVIDDFVYLWRIRDDESSITQQVADERTFSDKIEQMSLAHQYLCDNGYDEVRAVFEEKSLTRDFRQGVQDVANGDDGYAKMVCVEGAEFLERMRPESILALPKVDQLKFHLVSEGRLDDLRDLVTGGHYRSNVTVDTSSSPVRVVNDFAAGLYPPVPVELTVSEDKPPLVLSRVFISWDNEHLVVSATAAIPGLGGPMHKVTNLRLSCDHHRNGFEVPVEMLPLADGGVSGLIDSLQINRRERAVRVAPFSRFRARVRLADLIPQAPAEFSQWRFSVKGEADGLERHARLPKLSDQRLPENCSRSVNGFDFLLISHDHVGLRVSTPQ